MRIRCMRVQSKARPSASRSNRRPWLSGCRTESLAGRLGLMVLCVASWLAFCVGADAAAVATPIEFRPEKLSVNLLSQRGVPISATANNPPGSDGRMTNINETFGSANLPTAGQFASLHVFGGANGATNWLALSNNATLKAGVTPFSASVAAAMQLPVARSNNTVVMVLRQARIASPFMFRQLSFSFGSIVEAPLTDEAGMPLTNIVNTAYWLPEPYSTNRHTNAAYYFSPHAQSVFAIQSGPLAINWRKAQPYTLSTVPTNYINHNGSESFYTNGANVFLLHTVRYIVSGSAVKTPRKMFWTERDFRRLGRPITVPNARVGGINIVYNRDFPRTVDAEYRGPGYTSPVDGSTNQTLSELRTLWYDQSLGQMFAYNTEGRVFVELLGDARPDGLTREHLGFEIVDVAKQALPLDVTIDLGERVTPPPPGLLTELAPEPLQQVAGDSFAYEHIARGGNDKELYASRETQNLNDYQILWMEEGLVGLMWPSLLGRYHFVWPSESTRYSLYLRPLVATDAEARQTAVALPRENAPMLVYQDPMDRARADLTQEFKFYSFLDAAHPVHRSLLRYVSDMGDVAFERVLSVLNTEVRSPAYDQTWWRRGASMELDGNTGYGQMPAGNYFDGGSFSIETWVYLRQHTPGQRIIDFSITNGSERVALTAGSSSSGPVFQITRGSETRTVVGTNALPLATWVHLAAVFDATSTNGILYLNGQEIGRGQLLLPTNAVRSNCFIGRSAENALHLNGMLDNIRIWNVALTPAQVAAASMRDYPSGTAGLRAQYLFNSDDGISGAASTDSSGNNLSLTMFGANPLVNARLRPRLVQATATVGDRINSPSMEMGSGTGEDYLAGYIHQAEGTAFNVNAYSDPYANGFDAAAAGSIIPINAIPGKNVLEVWWFRPNTNNAGPNAGSNIKGFKSIFWPSVIGRYTIQWPSQPREIVLASKLCSGTLGTYEALGSIYYQNDRALPGYNPNEEHAIMSGGMAYATRDDLNITNGTSYSSMPFVLVDYVAADGRPSMAAFRVLREKPSEGYVFDYVVEAGRILQPPPPLTFFAKPVYGEGDEAINYNAEPSLTGGDHPGAWNESVHSQDSRYAHYKRFTFRDRHNDFWVYRGLHSGFPNLAGGTYDAVSNRLDFPTNLNFVLNQAFSFTVHASRQSEYLSLAATNLPPGFSVSGLTIQGTCTNDTRGSNTVRLVLSDLYDNTNVTYYVTFGAGAVASAQGPLQISSTNGYTGSVITYSNRPPFLAVSPTASNSFTMHYYYKTQPSFAWPAHESTPPPPGSIVPYLRSFNSTSNAFDGDPTSTATSPLKIVYRPVWPSRDPSDASKPVATLPYGATLTTPAHGLPGVRDMKTAHVLYQQSVARNMTSAVASAVLHDATRFKVSDLEKSNLKELPAGVVSAYYQGRYYFPNLPPHLAERVFYDPNMGSKGSLVVKGEYVREQLGESYLLLNVLRDTDLSAVLGLCPSADTDSTRWTNLVSGLSTTMETFHEDPARPGTYIPNPDLNVQFGVGDMAVVASDNNAVDSYALSATGPGSGYVTLLEANGNAFTLEGDPVAMHIFKVGGSLHRGEIKVLAADNPLSELVTFQHTGDFAGRSSEYTYEWRIAAAVDGKPPLDTNQTMSGYLVLQVATNLPRYTLGGAGIQALCDNYLVMRYTPANTNHPLYGQWSDWTSPALSEGWIKRVLAGINPFNQRLTDLFNNQVNTDVSLLTQAGRRWEGDVALNADTIDNYGLIEIYETVLRRGRMLSIESGFNYGPANDALLLAAGYLNDLYMMLGNEAFADASNPTIGIGTKDQTYADIATALFAFKGQMPSMLEEELALLRGRDDFLVPGVEVSPVYNRLIWNYTRGIDAGEVIYALNYNIQENPNLQPDGIINAADAAHMYPQGHGDAYGHYLTALKGYYSLLLNSRFDWVPRAEAVNVLGKPVQVDYQDERKFAATAAALARAGRQTFDLTWRRDFASVRQAGWSHMAATKTNPERLTTRYWGADHWASRTGQGLLVNWIVGNAILPEVDANPAHEGIQKIDRTTVPELKEMAAIAADQQSALDNAEGGLSPLGLPQDSIAFDIDPSAVVGTENGTHFEQLYQRATVALNNAVAAFDDAKDVTRLMRAEQDSLADFQASVSDQESSYENALIELYGTPYPDDMGPGKTYDQDYTGPDLVHYAYVDLPELSFPGLSEPAPSVVYSDDSGNSSTISFTLDSHGFMKKPDTWESRRASPGQLQEAISQIILARNEILRALDENQAKQYALERRQDLYKGKLELDGYLKEWDIEKAGLTTLLESAIFARKMITLHNDITKNTLWDQATAAKESVPASVIAGVASGGDMTSAVRGAMIQAVIAARLSLEGVSFAQELIFGSWQLAQENYIRLREAIMMEPKKYDYEHKTMVAEMDIAVRELQSTLFTINQKLRELDDAQARYRALVAQGDRLQLERESFRQSAAAVIQGYRTRDAGFRIFRNEKLERYKTLFDLAARYTLLCANGYDYETGLLSTPAGQDFLRRIVNSRALGVVRAGKPQYAGSNTGDPGLSSVLAEMRADWDVLRGRLGFNNPDAYGTTLSLRTECLRILPGTEGDSNWKDALQRGQMNNLLDDQDVRRYCMQIDSGGGLPVPGIVLTFQTVIADGLNLFGQPLAAGDHTFSPSAFANKIFAVGVALEGYRGMDSPSASSGSVTTTGSTSPSDPSQWFLDPLALSATPYVYLIPVGVDSMRVPPLGDTTSVRSWSVSDVSIPLPFNIGESDFSTKQLWLSSDSLTEPLFALRKHQAFRPVSSTDFFSQNLYTGFNTLQRSQYTNNRLVGRSVWNSQWKLVIPAKTLLENPSEGLDRFVRTVTDVKLHFITYSYSGN